MTESAAGRWWENYLVRYFMPSIAGIGIVSWLISIAPGIREILFFGNRPNTIDAPTLTLLVLYGNLFCYIASYPILCFHATRIIDDQPKCGVFLFLCGYKTSLLLSLLALGIFRYALPYHSTAVLILIVSIFSCIQVIRIYLSVKGISEEGEEMFSYLTKLSKKRCVSVPIIQIVGKYERVDIPENSGHGKESEDKFELKDVDVQHLTQEFLWRKEFTDSYRHMREHGNSAYIFVLEIALAAICYVILIGSPDEGWKKLANLGVILVLWSGPAIGVHCLAQSLERKFAREPQRTSPPQPPTYQTDNAHKTIDSKLSNPSTPRSRSSRFPNHNDPPTT